MRDADLLVNSSAHEGLPVTLIEGAMSGLPTVATDVGGNSEVVVDGVNGYVVPPGQPEQLAGAVMHILADPAVHRAFSRAAIEQGGRFTLDACADAHLDLYRTVASAPRPGFRDPQSGSITER
jgi:glycosyltransferase involved in cell wall biosynthesis